MGTTLTGLTPATTYDALIKTGDNAPIDATLKKLSDGLGNDLPMEVSTTEVNFTNQLKQGGVAVPTASQVAAKQDTLVSGTNIKTINSTSILGAGNISVAPASGIDATAIADGSVTNAEFQFINTLTSNAQTQIDGKQATLVSGTNIKTINSTSLLGSGNVAVQDVLVSGTNIKTINSTSLLGSGNINIAANPSGVSGAIQFSDGSAFASDATNFFWDNTNKRLGIGTNSPAALIDTYLAGTLTGNYMLGKFAFQTGGNNRNVYIKIGGGSSLFDLNVEAGNPYYELRYGNSATTLGPGIAQRVRYDGATAIPKQLIVGSETVQTTNMLQIKGSGSTSATTSLLVQNSAGTDLFKISDNGAVTVLGLSGTVGNPANFTSTTNDLSFRCSYYFRFLTTGDNKIIFGSSWDGANTYAYNENRQVVGSSSIAATAQFQIDSTTRGFLPPRMTTTQKNAIASPASGLVVYDSTTNKLCCYDGSTWNDLF